jgi:L,D-transpeptidase catalytic domain
MTSMRLRLFFTCMVPACFISTASARSPKQDVLRPTTQILVVTTSDWNGVDGVLQMYERSQTKKKWKAVGAQIQVVVGKNGLGWGSGMPPTNDPALRDVEDPVKKEGDGKAPAGIFQLGTAFGYAPQQPAGWRMPYVHLTQSIECVDDTASKYYNRLVDNTQVSLDWNSSEHMLRSDELYRSGLVVDHNSDPVTPGSGSCIFMHIWRGPGRGTAGCTAMSPEQIESVLAWLDPAKKPLVVQLPLPQYKQLRKRWELPALTPVNNR